MKQQSFFLSALIGTLFVTLFYSCDKNCDDGFRDQTFDEPSWTTGLRSNIPLESIRLNNYTSSPGRFCDYTPDPENPLCNTPQNINSSLFCAGAELQFKHPGNSSISFPVLGTQYFDIEVPCFGPDNMLGFYLNNINSSSLNVDARNNRLVIGIDFESCCMKEGIGDCSLSCGTGVQEFNLDSIHIDLAFNLDAKDGRIIYTGVEVSADADFEHAEMCSDNAFAFLCGDGRPLVFENLQSQLRMALMQPGVRSYLNQALHTAITNDLGLGERTIRKAAVVGDQLILNLECE